MKGTGEAPPRVEGALSDLFKKEQPNQQTPGQESRTESVPNYFDHARYQSQRNEYVNQQ